MARVLAGLATVLLSACATQPPADPGDACKIFSENEEWYESVREASVKWAMPWSLPLAIIRHESGFVEDARPPRYHLLGLIPLWRSSSAYGYGQALDGTWEDYRAVTGNGGADRDEFADVVDFIGWYVDRSHAQLGIGKDDVYHQYLAYHEGWSGYRRGSYLGKPGLDRIARAVAASAGRYDRQLTQCRDLRATIGHLTTFDGKPLHSMFTGPMQC